MNVKYDKTTSYIALSAVLVLVLLFVPFPQGGGQKAVVMPSAEFKAISSGGGAFSHSLTDLWKNQISQSQEHLPDRGGVFTYQRNPEITSDIITRGDTLGWFISSSLLDKIVTLEGNISTLKANLAFEQSGSRASVIQAARLQLDYARTRHAEQLKVLERSKSLLERNVITLQEYELDERRERLDAIRVSIAEADLGSALSGSQASKLDIYRTQIEDEEQKLKISRDMQASLTLVSPISGKLGFPKINSTLFTIGKMDTVVVIVPIDGAAYSMSDWTSRLSLSGPDFEMDIAPEQVKVTEQVLGGGSSQMLLIRIKLSNPEGKIIPGQFLDASLSFQSKSIYQLLRDMF